MLYIQIWGVGLGWWILFGGIWFIIFSPIILSLSMRLAKKFKYQIGSEVSKFNPYISKDCYTKGRLYQMKKKNYV